MLNHNIIFEKDKLNKSNKEHLMLLELEGFHKKTKKVKEKNRQKLNISLVIDVSGSMGCSLNNEYGMVFQNRMINNNMFNENQHITKLDLVKKAAINAVNSMEYGDYISIVAFHSTVNTLLESIELNKENKEIVIQEINNLQVAGATNLHGGFNS